MRRSARGAWGQREGSAGAWEEEKRESSTKKNERMRAGGEWDQEKHGDRISARGAWGQPEGTGETLVKINKKHKNKTLDTKNNEYIQTLEESNAQICFK